MIDEVEVISPGGVPVYYHHNNGDERDPKFLLQASFITALTQFATELENGEVKLITMEKKKYLLKKTNDFTIIFTTQDVEAEGFLDYQNELNEVSEYFNQTLVDHNIDPDTVDISQFDGPMNDLSSFLTEKDIISKADTYDSESYFSEVNRLIFKSVGYEPGKCNIGKGERMRRLAFGMVFFTISFLLLTLMVVLELPDLVRIILVVPNFLGFLGLFQYFYRFCTTNAMQEQYDMS